MPGQEIHLIRQDQRKLHRFPGPVPDGDPFPVRINADPFPVFGLPQRTRLAHAVEDLLMSTGAITPIYYYTDIYMVDSSVNGFFANPLGYKYFMYCTIK